MANEVCRFTTPANPIGRIVQGSLSKGQDKDADGKPLVAKSGVNAGKPLFKFYIAVAIPKTDKDKAHWAHSEYGAKILATGRAAFGPIADTPTFAWKVEDGDSAVPNKRGNKNCDREGFPGNWILNMSMSVEENISPIQCFNSDGTMPMSPADIRCGDYVQVLVDCKGNGSTQNPGVYLNPRIVAFAGHGKAIISGPDVRTAGFGGAVLPPGASATPVGGLPGASAPPPAAAAAPYAPAPLPGAYAPPPAAAAPNAAILGLPGASPAPAAPPPPAAGPVPTAKAAGATVEQMLAWPGWTMETLKANGYIA